MGNKYQWTNAASAHLIERMRGLLPSLPDVQRLLAEGIPRYPAFVVDSIQCPGENRRLDFAVEYDIYNPSQGIYFGCKETTLTASGHQRMCVRTMDEWEKLRPVITRRLNNLFPGTDFTFRFLPPDNNNDNTFWPFWIQAYEGEDLKDFACRVLAEIAKVYRECFDGSRRKPLDTGSSNTVRQRTPKAAFTAEVYSEFLSYIANEISRKCCDDRREELKEQGAALVERFVERGIEEGFFLRIDGYGMALSTDGCRTDIEFKALMDALFGELAILTRVDSLRVPWSIIIRLFIHPDEHPYQTHIKTQHPLDDTKTWADVTVKKFTEQTADGRDIACDV